MNALIVLQWIGRVFLILLAIAVVLLLLILLVPVRYEGQLRVDDPVPHEAAEWDRILHAAEGRFRASWMGPLLRLTIDWQDSLQMDLQILFIHRDPAALLQQNKTDSKEETPSSGKPARSPGDRIRALYRKVDYYKRVLQKEETGYTLDKGKRILLGMLKCILPGQWGMRFDVGLGDPAATAKVLEIQGMLYPLIAGHVIIRPEFMQYQMNLEGACKGGVRLIHPVIALLRILTDRKVMRTFRRIRNADRNIEAHVRRSMVNGG